MLSPGTEVPFRPGPLREAAAGHVTRHPGRKGTSREPTVVSGPRGG